ncbi:MFS transporter [Actinocatenispora comari]|uniref:MFS transporter n=1 Tax=Actinocatenispora comari TaxID=2807577 RepID=UPI001A929982|nr:MFS transporter [Actinocatenispora comari]
MGSDGSGSWRDLGAHLGTAVVLAGGVLIGAVNIYVAASLLPTAVTEIGGERLYAWNMTAFLVAQLVATLFVRRVLAGRGTVGAYLIGFGVFAAGSVVCAASPTMAVLLVGRALQGLGAGLLTGLGFALVQAALPRSLWARGSALISAMYGVGNFVGPALGGLFAQFGSWRLAFVVLAAAAVGIAVLVPRTLPRGGSWSTAHSPRPGSVGLIVAAAGAVSVGGIVTQPLAKGALVVLGLLLVVAFLVAERRTTTPVLPRSTYRPGASLPWVYVTIAVLAAGTAVEAFLPLFAQRLGGLPPLLAGFFGAALSLGWAGSQVLSSSAHRSGVVRLLRPGGPAVLAVGLAVLAALLPADGSTAAVLAWLPLLLLAGAGIGLAMPHLSVAAMTGTADPDEANQAAAGIATVLTMATAFGAAVAGLLVNLGGADTVAAGRFLLLAFAVVAALGVPTAMRAQHRTRSAATDDDLGDPDRASSHVGSPQP